MWSAAPSTVIDAVLALAGELAEHLVTPGRAGRLDRPVLRRACRRRPGRVYGRRAATLLATPAGPAAAAAAGPGVRRSASATLEAMDFGDQMARAARVARDHPEVGAVERDRYRVVLLDEYQDTSHAQVVLLRGAVRRRPPGDRGRRPVPVHLRLARRHRRHPGPVPGRVPRRRRQAGAGADADRRAGATGRRSSRVANALSAPLRAAGARVAELRRRSRDEPTGRPGHRPLRAAADRTRDEADWIADQVVAAWRQRGRHGRRAARAHPAGAPADQRGAGPACAARSRRSRRRCGRAACRSRWSASAACWTRPRSATSSARCGCSPTRPTGPRCCGCSPARAGGSARATWSRCTGGARSIAAARARPGAEPPRTSRSCPTRLDDGHPGRGAGRPRRAPQRYSAEGYARLRGVRRRAGRAAPPARPAAARPGRRRRAHHRARRRGGGAGGAAAATPAWPAATSTRSATSPPGSPVTADGGDAAGVPGLPRGRRGRGARPGAGRGRGGRGRGPDPHRARRQGPGVGRGRGRRPDQAASGRARPRAPTTTCMGLGVLPFPLRGDPTACPRSPIDGAGDQTRGDDARSSEFDEDVAGARRARGAPAGVRRGDPAQRGCCSARATGGATGVKRPRGPSRFLDRGATTPASRAAGEVDAWAPRAGRRDQPDASR